MPSARARIQKRLTKAGVELTPGQVDQLDGYFCLLAKWNTSISLTSLKLTPPTDEAVDRLLVEPAVAAKRLGLAGATGRLVDLGSGGGSPGFPLKIAAPDLDVALVESKTRKSAFLREVVRTLPLTRIEVVTARFEELLTKPDFHESANYLSLRAVRADPKLWRTVLAFLKVGGRVLWFASLQQGKTSLPPQLIQESTERLPTAGSHLIVLRKLA